MYISRWKVPFQIGLYTVLYTVKQPSSLKLCPWHSIYEGRSVIYIMYFIPFYFNFRIHHLHQIALTENNSWYYQWHQTLNNNFQGFSTEGHCLAYTHHTEQHFPWYLCVSSLHTNYIYTSITYTRCIYYEKIKRRIVHCCSFVVASICVLMTCRIIFVVCLCQIRFVAEACVGY